MVRVVVRWLLEVGRLALRARQWPDDYLFVRALYRVCLKREPDEDGLSYYLVSLQRKSMSRVDVLRSVLQSNEFRLVHRLPIHPLHALHQARMMVVRQHLPPANSIVDLGGASEGHLEGALLAMGYPHHPHQIIIVDLPPDQRMGKQSEPVQELITADGVHVRYHYGSMTDLSPIPEGSVDLVWAGESIEHVTEEEAATVCQEVVRILKPGGYFCLDTPNAALTRLQSPDRLIHPEHKKEYTVREMRMLLQRAGFEIVEAMGICPMRDSLQRGVFIEDEIVRNIRLSENPEEGYLFFLKAVKAFQSMP